MQTATITPDAGDLIETLRMLARGEEVVVGTCMFANEVQREAPFRVDVSWVEDDLWKLRRLPPTIGMPQISDLRKFVSQMPEWRRYMEQIHDEAGLDVWDEDLSKYALADLMDEIEHVIEERMSEGNIRRAGVVGAYLQTKKAPVGTGA